MNGLEALMMDEEEAIRRPISPNNPFRAAIRLVPLLKHMPYAPLVFFSGLSLYQQSMVAQGKWSSDDGWVRSAENQSRESLRKANDEVQVDLIRIARDYHTLEIREGELAQYLIGFSERILEQGKNLPPMGPIEKRPGLAGSLQDAIELHTKPLELAQVVVSTIRLFHEYMTAEDSPQA